MRERVQPNVQSKALSRALAAAAAAAVLLSGGDLALRAFAEGHAFAALSLSLLWPEGGAALLQSQRSEGETDEAPDGGEPGQTPEATVTPGAQPIANTAPPAVAGSIVAQTYGVAAGTKNHLALAHGYIRNATSTAMADIAAIVKAKPSFVIAADGSPEVLIMHTHTTESYELQESPTFMSDSTSRTTDPTKNMVAVGEAMAAELRAMNIGVIHNTVQHDYPSYNGSYDRSRKTVQEILAQNPTIKVIIDLHRDAIERDGVRYKPVTVIDGQKVAQIMIIAGCDNGKLGLDHWQENLKFAALFQNTMERDYPTLTRPILFDYRHYNQDLTTGSILVEVGGHANTLDEALRAGTLAGRSLAKTLRSLM